MIDFPQIKRATVATRKGNFYKLVDGHWYKAELYLPCATGTYQEQLDHTAVRFLDDLESGKREFKHAISDNGSVNQKKLNRLMKTWFKNEF